MLDDMQAFASCNFLAIAQAVRLTQEQYNGLCHQDAQEH